MLWKAAWVQRCRLNFCKPLQVSPQNLALQDEVGELAFTNNLDQTGHLQLFHVMRKCRGAHTVDLVQFGAGRRVTTCTDLFENLISSWFGQSPGYTRKLPVRKAANLGGCHSLQGTPDLNQMSISRAVLS